MPKSLSIECDFIAQPGAADAIEARTWADLRIRAGDICATRIFDRETEAARERIFIPAYPVARWIASNWWAIINEPARSENSAETGGLSGFANTGWAKRHCFRWADSGVMLPNLCIHADGGRLVADCRRDEATDHIRMPGYFTDDGRSSLSKSGSIAALETFVGNVLDRLSGLEEPEAVALRRDWAAIRQADPDEVAFCNAAGQLGLDPYYVEGWPTGLARFLEVLTEPEELRPAVDDLLEAEEPASVEASWTWVKTAMSSNGLVSSRRSAHGTVTTGSAWPSGRKAALTARAALPGGGSGRVDMSEAGHALTEGGFEVVDTDQLGSGPIWGVAGYRSVDRKAVFAGPLPWKSESQRFRAARALYMVLHGCGRGARLVTGALTWDQQASRAFAAEFLAPRGELADRVRDSRNPTAPRDLVEELSAQYDVSVQVIEHQLTNAGVKVGEVE